MNIPEEWTEEGRTLRWQNCEYSKWCSIRIKYGNLNHRTLCLNIFLVIFYISAISQCIESSIRYKEMQHTGGQIIFMLVIFWNQPFYEMTKIFESLYKTTSMTDILLHSVSLNYFMRCLNVSSISWKGYYIAITVI